MDEDEEATHTSILDALGWSSALEATDPKDKIFGILGLCYDGSNLVPTPDYCKSLDTILRELRIAELSQEANRKWQTTRSMDLICLDNPKIPKRGRVSILGTYSISQSNLLPHLHISYPPD